MFDLQPTLVGECLTLRPLLAEDREALAAVASDPLIWAQHPDPARSTRTGFDRFFDQALESRGTLVAIEATTGQIIGCSRYHGHKPGLEVTIGYTFLARAYWGGRYNGEMKRLMLRHAFHHVEAVKFRIAERNLRSRRAVEKLGALLVGPEDTPQFGQIHVIYRLTEAHWSGAKAMHYTAA